MQSLFGSSSKQSVFTGVIQEGLIACVVIPVGPRGKIGP